MKSPSSSPATGWWEPGGSLTGYAGGIEKKVRLLQLEHADMSRFFVPTNGTAL